MRRNQTCEGRSTEDYTAQHASERLQCRVRRSTHRIYSTLTDFSYFQPRFARLYDNLPPNAQHLLVTRQLIPLLKKTHHLKAERILSRTRRAKVKYAHLPQLDTRLSQKKAEINGLIEELQRDQKIAYFTDRSCRDELLYEVVQSVSEWLNDLWSLVYEYRTDFKRTHSCLLFSLGVLDHLQTVRGLCVIFLL